MLARALLLVTTLALAACAGASDDVSMYPGELGAPCATAADCNEGLLCSKQLNESEDYSDCYMPCSGEGGTCPEGSFCAYRATSPTDPRPWVCRRACTDDDFCLDLHPDATGCKEYSGNPEGKLSCGIKG